MAQRESAAAKARRYLVEGRVVLARVTDDEAVAQIRGDGAIHSVVARSAYWSCTCPAYGRCAHLLAVGLVIAVGRPHNITQPQGGQRR